MTRAEVRAPIKIDHCCHFGVAPSKKPVLRSCEVVPAFEAVLGAVTVALRQQGFVTAMRQYLQVLAGAAIVEGVDLEGAEQPLVQ